MSKGYSNKPYRNSFKQVKEKREINVSIVAKKKGHIALDYKVKKIIGNLNIGKHLKQQMINRIKTESWSDSSEQPYIESANED